MAARIARPALLWLVSVIAFGGAALAGAGLVGLHGARLAGPVTLVSETERLEDALADGPWTGSDPNGPIVWAFVRPACDNCGDFSAASLAALADEDMELRVVVVAGREDASGPAATLAEMRDWSIFEDWANGATPEVASRDPAAQEGYREWGRASWDRVAAILRLNGVDPRPPLLIWRRGPEWRVLVGTRAATLDALRRDMAVES
jgi:hypothetical protein